MKIIKDKKGMLEGGSAVAVDLAVGAVLLGILAVAVGWQIIFSVINDTTIIPKTENLTGQQSGTLSWTVAQYIPVILLVVVLVAFIAYLYGKR